MSIKSSGTNYYLYFTCINNINYCFFIDRKIKSGYTYPRIISVKYAFDDSIFQDTLLDGELVRDSNDNDAWIFLITDILVHKGKKINCNIVNRFNLLYDMLTNDYNKFERQKEASKYPGYYGANEKFMEGGIASLNVNKKK
jgi:hypothetical protein